MPDIAELSKNIVIEQTKEGVNVSLVDQDGRAMFREGSVDPYERTRRVLEALAPALRRLPNSLSITGHTAAARPGSARTAEPWNLTAGRALAVREILSGAGVPNDHFSSVVGRADTEPVFPDNPYIAPNRRGDDHSAQCEPAVPRTASLRRGTAPRSDDNGESPSRRPSDHRGASRALRRTTGYSVALARVRRRSGRPTSRPGVSARAPSVSALSGSPGSPQGGGRPVGMAFEARERMEVAVQHGPQAALGERPSRNQPEI